MSKVYPTESPPTAQLPKCQDCGLRLGHLYVYPECPPDEQHPDIKPRQRRVGRDYEAEMYGFTNESMEE